MLLKTVSDFLGEAQHSSLDYLTLEEFEEKNKGDGPGFRL